jgi:hypothetical protein
MTTPTDDELVAQHRWAELGRRHHGLSDGALRWRIKNWPPEAWFITPMLHQRRHPMLPPGYCKMCRDRGISPNTVREQVKRGMTFKEAMEKPRREYIEYESMPYTATEIARDQMVSDSQLRRWLRKGYPLHEALAQSASRKWTKHVWFSDRYYNSHSKLCREQGIRRGTFSTRVRQGWSVDDAVRQGKIDRESRRR